MLLQSMAILTRSRVPRLSRRLSWLSCLVCLGVVAGAGYGSAGQVVDASSLENHLPRVRRAIPEPLSTHPGNIYLEGQQVSVVVPSGPAASAPRWRALDVAGQEVDHGLVAGANHLNPRVPGVGWYRIEFLNDSQTTVAWTSAAVLSRLKAPVPADSPVCLDMAVSWFERNNPSNQTIHANLAALAGVNWVRDRLTWGDVQSGPSQFAAPGNYDEAARIQKQQGLRVLQVFHGTPRWACEDPEDHGRFAPDLRHVYRFTREVGERFGGRVLAWEPWNEANIESFGGHAMDEIASWQKAAWHGFKASGAPVLVGWSAMAAVPTPQQTEGVLLNEAWPYFDTYNIHTYDWAHSYREIWQPARVAAGGKPLWITEADRGAQHDKQAPWYDLSPRLERLKAEYAAQSYASALAAGASRHFQFILGHYQEPNGVQFGLLRKDFTPRPAYVALAAVGRFLAGAHCVGAWHPTPEVNVVGFKARPDGVVRDVLVVWTEREADWESRGTNRVKMTWPALLKVAACYDFLGRPLATQLPQEIGSAPMFILLPRNQMAALPLEQLPLAEPRSRVTSPLVLQTLFSKEHRVPVEDVRWSGAYAYGCKSGEKTTFTLAAYNFGKATCPMEVSVEKLPSGWVLSPMHWSWELASMDRKTTEVTLTCGPDSAKDGWVVLRGRSRKEPDAVVAFRMLVK